MNFDRLREAYAYVSSLPAEEFNLAFYFLKERPCGCALGYLAKAEMFGMRLEEEHGRFIPVAPDGAGDGYEAAENVFDLADVYEAEALFGTRGRSFLDVGPSAHSNMTDKELWMHRIERFFATNGQTLNLPEVVKNEPAGATTDVV